MLGGTTLVAHLTAGHTRGATTWTTRVTDGGRSYDVVFFSSLRAPNMVAPDVAKEFDRTFARVRTLPCDVPLGDHPAQYGLDEKFARLKPGAANPFIDKANCLREATIQEAMYRAVLEEQRSGSSRR
jgi:metallo-beta-lactamase class B